MADELENEQNQVGLNLKLPIPTDEEWLDVMYINSYAMTMAYLSMGVRGLAYLVITWTTVVLLGGFVSLLGKKDFWGLTVIVLAQTAGVFDVFLREKLSEIWCIYQALVVNSSLLVFSQGTSEKACAARVFVQSFINVSKLVLKLLVISIVMFPLAVLYASGLFISTGLSLWRLIEQDYGDPDGSANLRPALQLLYTLALVQGVLFSYRAYFGLTEKDVIKKVAKGYKFDGDYREQLISGYTMDIKIGCEKDPTFAKGRNLITYAVELIKSEAPLRVISGVTILEQLLELQQTEDGRVDRDELVGQHLLIKQLIGSTSSSRIQHKLVLMLDPRCPYSSTVRRGAASIVEWLASDIHLDQLPRRAIHCITSLLNEEYRTVEPYQRDWLLETYGGCGSGSSKEILDHYRQVFEQEPYSSRFATYGFLACTGLQILWKLCLDEENCRVVSNTQGLVSKIMVPLRSEELKKDHHYVWSKVAEATLQLLGQLVYVDGEAGQKLRRQICNDTQAISTMESAVLKSVECSEELQRRAISTLSCLFFHESSASADSEQQSRSRFIHTLTDILADHSKRSNTREMACAELAKLSSKCDHCKAMVAFVLEENDAAVKNVTGVLLLNTNDKRIRTSAAVILQNLSGHYNTDDERFKTLRGDIITEIMPEVVREILCYGSTGHGKQTGDEAADSKEFSPPHADLEKGNVSQDNARNATPSPEQNDEQQEEVRELLKALLILCSLVYDKSIDEDPHLAQQFDDAAAAICLELENPTKTFADLLEQSCQQLLDAGKN